MTKTMSLVQEPRPVELHGLDGVGSTGFSEAGLSYKPGKGLTLTLFEHDLCALMLPWGSSTSVV